jgi:hypothetical protein
MRNLPPIWLHFVATLAAGLIWLGMALGNALVPALAERPLDLDYAQTVTTALGATLIQRFTPAAPAEPTKEGE